MKTSKNLFEGIVAFDNVLSAARHAAKGKREEASVLRFYHHFEDNIRQTLSGWFGHARRADTRNLLRLISVRIWSGK